MLGRSEHMLYHEIVRSDSRPSADIYCAMPSQRLVLMCDPLGAAGEPLHINIEGR